KLIELRRKLQDFYSNPDFIAAAKINVHDLDNQFLSRLRTILLENLSNADGIPEICKAMHISRIQLHRKLKALTGKSASHHIRSIRLREAYRLLEQSKLNVSEVAYEVGFTSPAYFSTTFLNEYGLSPSEIRKGAT